jgi:hypothetical protein
MVSSYLVCENGRTWPGRKPPKRLEAEYNKFADLIKAQVGAFKQKGSGEAAFRVAVKQGKVAFTARAMKGLEDD